MNGQKAIRCAIYTRKSTEEGLEQSFNSLDAQREACEAYITSQRHEGWQLVPDDYNDGGFSGGNMERLTLNVLLSFAQFEREVTGERVRDKVAASKKKGMWMGGHVPLGYDRINRELIINEVEAETVRNIFSRYLQLKSVRLLYEDLKKKDIRTKPRTSPTGEHFGGVTFSRGMLYHLLSNPLYAGKIQHKDNLYPGLHKGIVPKSLWDEVEALLRNNRYERKLTHNVRSGRHLIGRLVTEQGKPFTPTHASKASRRYFYYTLRDSTPDTSSLPKSLPAIELERIVLQRVAVFLCSPLQLAKEYAALPSSDLKIMTAVGGAIAAVAEQNEGEIIWAAVSNVTIRSDTLLIELDKQRIHSLLNKINNSRDSCQIIQLETPLTIVKRGSDVRLVIRDGALPKSKPIPSLVRAVQQAQTWAEWIITGRVRSISELASKAGLSRQYATRILRLAALSPKLSEAILRGEHAPTLTVVELTQSVPLDWNSQVLP